MESQLMGLQDAQALMIRPRPELEWSESFADLFAALSAFQGELTNAVKDSSNPHFKSKYADLAAVMDVAREPLAKHGLALVQMPVGTCTTHVRIVTVLTHKSGQWMRGSYDMPLDKQSAQAVGSAITYARRYCAMAVLGIAAEDDDGEAATGRDQPRQGGQQQAQRPFDLQSKPRQETASAKGMPFVASVVAGLEPATSTVQQQQTRAVGTAMATSQQCADIRSALKSLGHDNLGQAVLAVNQALGLVGSAMMTKFGDPFGAALTTVQADKVLQWAVDEKARRLSEKTDAAMKAQPFVGGTSHET